ncbi:response regulator transcription factor [Spirosoma harenae]
MAAALSDLVRKFDEYDVLLVAENGRDLLNQLAASEQLPDIALVDVNMPEMNGFETTKQLRQLYPTIRVLALSMEDREDQIVRMVRNGARGYLLKDCRPSELRKALDDIMMKGYYYSDFLTSKLMENLASSAGKTTGLPFNLNDREYTFVQLACSDLTYNEVAREMSVAPRTVDGYRESVFQKMRVGSRVSMAIEAIRHGIIEL